MCIEIEVTKHLKESAEELETQFADISEKFLENLPVYV